jgi:hypothetical protein
VATDLLAFHAACRYSLVGAFISAIRGQHRVVDLCCRSDCVRFAAREWTKRLRGVGNVGNIQRLALPDSGRSPTAHVVLRVGFTIFLFSFRGPRYGKHLFADGIDILEDYHLARPSVEERSPAQPMLASRRRDIDWLCRQYWGEDGGASRVLYRSDPTLETYLRFSWRHEVKWSWALLLGSPVSSVTDTSPYGKVLEWSRQHNGVGPSLFLTIPGDRRSSSRSPRSLVPASRSDFWRRLGS